MHRSEEIVRQQAVLDAHNEHAEHMKQIETRAWREAEDAGWLLVSRLEALLGCPQRMPSNPFRDWGV